MKAKTFLKATIANGIIVIPPPWSVVHPVKAEGYEFEWFRVNHKRVSTSNQVIGLRGYSQNFDLNEARFIKLRQIFHI